MIPARQADQWQKLQQARRANRLPHALLFKGNAGSGKVHFAEQFIQSLLCTDNKPDGTACDKCHSCRLVIGKAHANIFYVAPEKEGQAIKIDQMRGVTDFINQSSLQAGMRVALINPADAMNVNAANALLKTLEEPSSHALLILISDHSQRLPATILSRCQFVHFHLPQNEMKPLDPDALALRQIVLQGLSDAKADPLKLSESVQGNEPLQVIDFYMSWLTDLLRLTVGIDAEKITHIDFKPQLMDIMKNGDAEKLSALIHYTQQTRKLICNGINLNKVLLLEDLFIRYMDFQHACRRSP